VLLTGPTKLNGNRRNLMEMRKSKKGKQVKVNKSKGKVTLAPEMNKGGMPKKNFAKPGSYSSAYNKGGMTMRKGNMAYNKGGVAKKK